MSRQAESIKQRYSKGTVVRLEHMDGEPDMPAGLRGEVAFVDDIGQIFVNWENGRSLALNTEVDSFQVVSKPMKKWDDPCR